MASQWQACPHCKVLFQFDAAKSPPPRQCPACKGALAGALTAPARPTAPLAQLVGVPGSTTARPQSGDARPPLPPSQPRDSRPPLATPGWYYAQNKKKHGPVPFAQLQRLAASGQLGAQDMILQEGAQKWLPAAKVTGVFAAQPASAIAPPPVNGQPIPAKPASVPGPKHASGWHYAKGKKRIGPITRALLDQLAATGQLLREDMVLPEGGSKWVEAGSIDGLFPSVSIEELAGISAGAPQELPKLPPRPRATSPHACPHCKGTAYCGRYWDTDGLLSHGPVCTGCREKSGIGPGQSVDKVTCAVCEGKGFAAEEDEAPSHRRDATAWRLRGLAFSDSGKYEEAITAYNEAIRLEPDFADAYYERGWAYLAAGASELGEADLAEAARLEPRYGEGTDSSSDAAKPSGWLPRIFRR